MIHREPRKHKKRKKFVEGVTPLFAPPKFVKGRKDYVCSACKKKIKKGERHWYMRWGVGKFQQRRFHNTKKCAGFYGIKVRKQA